jgi:DNA repair exonuclease SbcCD ATPase subunit
MPNAYARLSNAKSGAAWNCGGRRSAEEEAMTLRNRLREAFERLNERIDSAEDAMIEKSQRSLGALSGELAEVRSMLDVVARRLSALSGDARDELEPKLIRLRNLWKEAHDAYDVGKATGGKLRDEDEKQSRAALDEVESGILPLLAEINDRFAAERPAPTP